MSCCGQKNYAWEGAKPSQPPPKYQWVKPCGECGGPCETLPDAKGVVRWRCNWCKTWFEEWKWKP